MKTYGIGQRVTKPGIRKNDTPCIVCGHVEDYPRQDGTVYICGSCVARAGESVNFNAVLSKRE